MSFTEERSGTSVAPYTMLAAPAKADSMLVHDMFPHWSMERSLAALPSSPPRCMRSKPPDIRTVWSPGVAYACVRSPDTLPDTSPSPQCTVYVAVEPSTGIVMDSPGAAVLQVVIKIVFIARLFSTVIWAALLSPNRVVPFASTLIV